MWDPNDKRVIERGIRLMEIAYETMSDVAADNYFLSLLEDALDETRSQLEED